MLECPNPESVVLLSIGTTDSVQEQKLLVASTVSYLNGTFKWNPQAADIVHTVIKIRHHCLIC